MKWALFFPNINVSQKKRSSLCGKQTELSFQLKITIKTLKIIFLWETWWIQRDSCSLIKKVIQLYYILYKIVYYS